MGSSSISTRSLASTCALVNPQATWVLLPVTSVGWPGSVRPASSRVCDGSASSRHSSTARYHVFGTRMSRCMSLATSARPVPVRSPDTAQLLLPSAASPSRRRPRVDRPRFGRPSDPSADRSPACRCACAAGCRCRVPGTSGSREGRAHDRRIPLGAARREQLEHRRRQDVAHRRQRGLVLAAGFLQRDEHRQHDEHAVFRRPGLAAPGAGRGTRTGLAPSVARPRLTPAA